MTNSVTDLQLPLLGSNQDSPDPEAWVSRPSIDRFARIRGELAAKRDRRPTESHTVSRTLGKHCPRCQQTKPAGDFNRRSRGNSLQPYCRPCMLAYHAEWRATPEGNRKFNTAENASKARYPERLNARRAVKYALDRGDLVRGPCCLVDSSCRGKIQAHHDDYSKPLDVRWACKGHHTQLDQERRAKEAA